MAGSFVCTMVSSAKPGNAARPSDPVSIHFSDPPDAATDVTIELIQADTSKVVTTFKGAFVGKVFKSSIIIGNTFISSQSFTTGGKLSDDLDQLVNMVITVNVDGKSKCKVRLSDPPPAAGGAGATNLENKLKLRVSGTITGGGQQTFEGQSILHIYYSQVMIVPSGPVVTDDALRLIPKWATQWQKAHKEMRTIVSLPVIIPPSRRRPPRDSIVAADYDAIVAAVTAAAAKAPGGIIALAVGHGDGGQGRSGNTPWCDLAAEDGKQDEYTYFRDLGIDLNELVTGERRANNGITTVPAGDTVVRLNGMDRMADALTPTDPDAPRLRKLPSIHATPATPTTSHRGWPTGCGFASRHT